MSGERKGERQEGEECPWCHRKVKKLNCHHYPIPKKLGGSEIVEVCRSCHMKDEALINMLISIIKFEIKYGRQLILFGEEPYAERKNKIKEAMKRAEEEKKKQPKLLTGGYKGCFFVRLGSGNMKLLRFKKYLWRLLVPALVLLLVATAYQLVMVKPAAAVPYWQIETVDSAGDVGYYTSIALDAGDHPHISYYDSINRDLKYAYWDGSTWHTETVDSMGWMGAFNSIALDAGDNPHISYFDSTNSDLKYAYWDGSTWHKTTVDSAGWVGEDTSIALDGSDRPRISYRDSTNGDLKYAYYDGSTWHKTTVDSFGSVGYYTSIALDTGDNPHISYFDFTNTDLKYAYWDGSTWHTETVDSTGIVGYFTSIALDTDHCPHISYCDFTNGNLKYAYYDGSQWQKTAVDWAGYVGYYTSIALDGSDNPHISYYDVNNKYLKYAYWDGSEWQKTTVDSAGRVGWWTSIALDTGDHPHISYFDWTNYDLKYARQLVDNTPPTGPTEVHSTSHTLSTWSNDNTINVAWNAATDTESGLDGYSTLWDTNLATIPPQTKNIEEDVLTATSPTLADGSSHWFHISSVDIAGNWQSTIHLGPFSIDTTPPSNPDEVHSTSHTEYSWSNDNTIDVAWNAATDTESGLDGYSTLWDTNPATIPPQTKNIDEDVLTATSPTLADGSSHYFHIRSVDNAGNWQSTIHLGPFFIDTTPPSDPTNVHSTSHTLSTWSNDNTVDVAWTDATDPPPASGLYGYSILWDTNDDTIPNQTKDIEKGEQPTTSLALADGSSHYFHIRSVDNAGNWQSTKHLGPFFIDTTAPSDPTNVHSTSHTVSTRSSDNTIDVTWTDATDAGSSLGGYSILWDTNATTIPDAVKDIEQGVQATTSAALADGNSHYFHIRSVDNLGNWQSTVHLGPFFIDTTAPPAQPARPARFLATYPHIVPTRVLPNQPVNILLNVKNVAASGGYYSAVLYIDGEVEYTQTAYISPGQTQRLVFTVYRETPGKYWAAVEGYGAWFTVAEAAEVAEYKVVTSPPPPSGGLGTPALLAIILGSVGVGVAIFFATRPRRI